MNETRPDSTTLDTTYSLFFESKVRIDFVTQIAPEIALYIFEFNMFNFGAIARASLVCTAWRDFIAPEFRSRINKALISCRLLHESKIDDNPWKLLKQLHFSDCRFYVDASASMRTAKSGDKRKKFLCDAIKNTAQKCISDCLPFIPKIKLFSFAEDVTEGLDLPNELSIMENLDKSVEMCKTVSTCFKFLQPILKPFEKKEKNLQKERVVLFVFSDLEPQSNSYNKTLAAIENMKKKGQKLNLVFFEVKNPEEEPKKDKINSFKERLVQYAKRNTYLTVIEEDLSETIGDEKASEKKKRKSEETDPDLQKEGSAKFHPSDQAE